MKKEDKWQISSGSDPNGTEPDNPKERPNFISCNMHPGSILLKMKDEPMLQCPSCGAKYPDPDAKRKSSYPSQEIGW